MSKILVTRKSEQELETIAKRIVNNKLYIDAFISDDIKAIELRRVFTPLVQLEQSEMLILAEQVGLFFASYEDQIGETPDGNPMFKSIRMIHKDDMETLNRYLMHYTPVSALKNPNPNNNVQRNDSV